MSHRLFYERYIQAFDEAERCISAASQFANAGQRRLFVQTLFNRLLFLRFVELKHWLEFESRCDYLRALYAAGGVRGKSVYRSRFVPLFRALSGKPLRQGNQIGNVPVLAGGPFQETELDRQAGDVPDAALAPLIGKQGLFYTPADLSIEESSVLRDDANAVDPGNAGNRFRRAGDRSQ